LLSPILVFTSDEAWENLPASNVPSVHIAEFPVAVEVDNSGLAVNWERVFSIRDEVLKALEEARNDKQIGSSLEAKDVLTIDAATTRLLLDYYEQLRYIFIVSQVEVHEGEKFAVVIQKADGQKCELLELFDACWGISGIPTVCEAATKLLGDRGWVGVS
jgi:isoleucyl-tRNA synthetase